MALIKSSLRGTLCAVCTCTNSRRKFPEKSFFSFPKLDINRCQAWIDFCEREWKDIHRREICQDHFQQSDFLIGQRTKLSRLRLKITAVPTIKLESGVVPSCINTSNVLPCDVNMDSQQHLSSGSDEYLLDKIITFEKCQKDEGTLGETNDEPSLETKTSVMDNFQQHDDQTSGRPEINPLNNDDSKSATPRMTIVGERCRMTPLKKDHSYCMAPSPSMSGIKSNLLRKLNASQKLVKKLQQKVRRQRVKINSLKTILTELSDKLLITQENSVILEENFSSVTKELFKSQKSNALVKLHGRRYSEDVKKFATTLHFYSPRAYDYIRTLFTLPAPSSLSSWSSSVSCHFEKQTNAVLNSAESNSTVR